MRLITHRGAGILRKELCKVSQCVCVCVCYQSRAPAQTKMASILLPLKQCQRQFKNRRKSQPGQFLSDCGNLRAWKDFRNRTFNRVDKKDHILRKKKASKSIRDTKLQGGLLSRDFKGWEARGERKEVWYLQNLMGRRFWTHLDKLKKEKTDCEGIVLF